MYNHMVRRTASVISPFYSILPGKTQMLKSTILELGLIKTELLAPRSCKSYPSPAVEIMVSDPACLGSTGQLEIMVSDPAFLGSMGQLEIMVSDPTCLGSMVQLEIMVSDLPV